MLLGMRKHKSNISVFPVLKKVYLQEKNCCITTNLIEVPLRFRFAKLCQLGELISSISVHKGG